MGAWGDGARNAPRWSCLLGPCAWDRSSMSTDTPWATSAATAGRRVACAVTAEECTASEVDALAGDGGTAEPHVFGSVIRSAWDHAVSGRDSGP